MRIVLLSLLGLSGIAAAQAPDTPPPVKKPKLKCETVETTASRVGRKRVCYDPATRPENDRVRQDMDRLTQRPPN